MERLANKIEEKIVTPRSGWGMLALEILLLAAAIAFIVLGATGILPEFVCAFSIPVLLVAVFFFAGFKVLAPNEAYVFTLFGKYYGTVREPGFYFVNPFVTAMPGGKTEGVTVNAKTGEPTTSVKIVKKVSLKERTLNNDKQKVNDLEGNPIEIGVMVIWKVENAAKAVFNVEDFELFVSTQCDSAIREIARQYPYDISENGEEKSLRGSSQEIADMLQQELQNRVEGAGLNVIDARITNLAYAPEIAAAMLQRQQAAAIIAARQKIVDGAVSMVEMALNKLSENNIVELDDERKAQMVSNLLVVLCGNKDAQPIVNSGSLY